MSSNSSVNSIGQPTAGQTNKCNEPARRSETPTGSSSRPHSAVVGQSEENDAETTSQSQCLSEQCEAVAEDSGKTAQQSRTSQNVAASTINQNHNYSFDLQFDTFQLPACARNCEAIHTVKSHQKELCKSLYGLYKDGEYCDITIRCGSRQIRCHKLVLVCISGYFRSMFGSGMRESVENTIELRDLPDDAVASLIEFSYSGQIALNTDSVQRLLFAASVLQIETVCAACDSFVRRHLTTSNCVGVRAFAELHGRFELMRAVDSYIADHFPLVFANVPDDFVAMNEASLAALLRQVNLNVANEQAVYDAVLRWTRFDIDNRRNAFEKLAAHIRFGQLPTDFLIETVCNEPLVLASADCLRYIDEAKTFKLAQSFLPSHTATPRSSSVASASSTPPPPPQQPLSSVTNASSVYSTSSLVSASSNDACATRNGNTNGDRCTPRRSYAGVIFCVGGRGSTGEPYRSVECYNPVDNSWTFIAEMTSKRRHVGVISCGGRLYAIGGHDGLEHLNTGEVYEPRTNRWTRIASMSTKRRGLALASIGGAIYAIGGLDDSTCMSAVERYNIATDQWAGVASMNVPRGGVACVVFANHIYAAGGNDGTNSVDSCEAFDPVLDKWSIVASMHYKRAGAGMAALNDFVYVVGGFDNDLPLDSVEQYDFRTNSWSVITRMSVCRGGAGLVALANRLYTVGGHDGTDYLISVECFDPSEKRWINDVANISISRAGAGVTSCDVPIRVILDALETTRANSSANTQPPAKSNPTAAASNPSVAQLAYGLQHASISSGSNTPRPGPAASRGASNRSGNSVTSISSTPPTVNASASAHAARLNASASANGVAHLNVAASSAAGVGSYADEFSQSHVGTLQHGQAQSLDWQVTGAQCNSGSTCAYHHCTAYSQPAYQNVNELRQCAVPLGVHHGSGSGSGSGSSSGANASGSSHQRHNSHHCVSVSAGANEVASSPQTVVYVCPYHQQLARHNTRQRPASANTSSCQPSYNQHSPDQD